MTSNTGRFNNRTWGRETDQKNLAKAKELRDELKREMDLAAAKLVNAIVAGAGGGKVPLDQMPQGSPLREVFELLAFGQAIDSFSPYSDGDAIKEIGTDEFEKLMEDPYALSQFVFQLKLDQPDQQQLLIAAAEQFASIEGTFSDAAEAYAEQLSGTSAEFLSADQYYELLQTDPLASPSDVSDGGLPANNFAALKSPIVRRGYVDSTETHQLPDRGFHATTPLRFLRLSARNIGVAYSLQDLRQNLTRAARRKRDQYSVGYAPTELPLPGILGDEKLNVWLESRYTFANDSRAGAEADGEEFRLEVGLSYQIGDNIALGGKARYRSSSAARDNGSVDAEYEGRGGALFAQVLMPGGAVFTPLIAYERTGSEITLNQSGTSVFGEFDTDFTTFGAALSRQWSWSSDQGKSRFFIEPNTSVSIVEADRESYVRSDGEVIDSAEISQGTLTFGPTFGADFVDVSDNVSSVITRLKISGTWSFDAPDDVILLSGNVVEAQDLFASIRGSVDVRFRQGTRGTLSVGYAGIGSNISRTSVRATVVIPFR